MTLAESPAHLQHIAHRLSGAVYGTILATTVVASTRDHAENIGVALIIVVVTSLVFWLAHVYSSTIAARMVARRQLTRSEVTQLAAMEWPMLQSCVPVCIPLLLGWLHILDRTFAAQLAVAVGVGALVVYGLAIGIREERSPLGVVASGLLTGSFGLVILLLKLVVH